MRKDVLSAIQKAKNNNNKVFGSNQKLRKLVASTQKPSDTERSGFKDANKR